MIAFICGENTEKCLCIADYTNTALQLIGVGGVVRCFEHPDYLKKQLYSEIPHVVLIVLSERGRGFSGFEFIDLLHAKNCYVNVVFVASCASVPIQVLDYFPCAYLLDNCDSKDIAKAILLMEKSQFFLPKYYYVNKRDTIHAVDYSEIVFFESVGKVVTINTVDGNAIEFRGKLDDTFDNLNNSCFLRIHQSFLINALHAIYVSKSEMYVRMSTGDELPISKRRIYAVNKWFMNN